MTGLQYDMTNTKLFHATEYVRMPSDGELFAITAALLIVHGRSFGELAAWPLCVEECLLDALSDCLGSELKPLAGDLTRDHELRARLRHFVGMSVGGSDAIESVDNPSRIEDHDGCGSQARRISPHDPGGSAA